MLWTFTVVVLGMGGEPMHFSPRATCGFSSCPRWLRPRASCSSWGTSSHPCPTRGGERGAPRRGPAPSHHPSPHPFSPGRERGEGPGTAPARLPSLPTPGPPSPHPRAAPDPSGGCSRAGPSRAEPSRAGALRGSGRRGARLRQPPPAAREGAAGPRRGISTSPCCLGTAPEKQQKKKLRAQEVLGAAGRVTRELRLRFRAPF